MNSRFSSLYFFFPLAVLYWTESLFVVHERPISTTYDALLLKHIFIFCFEFFCFSIYGDSLIRLILQFKNIYTSPNPQLFFEGKKRQSFVVRFDTYRKWRISKNSSTFTNEQWRMNPLTPRDWQRLGGNCDKEFFPHNISSWFRIFRMHSKDP